MLSRRLKATRRLSDRLLPHGGGHRVSAYRLPPHQVGAALPAVDRPVRVQGAAGRTGAAGARPLEVQQPLHLTQLRINLLELGGLADKNVEPEVVPPRHLVDEPSEVPLELGKLSREPVTPLHQLRRPQLAGAGGQGGRLAPPARTPVEVVREPHQGPIVTVPEPPPGLRWSLGGGLPGVAMLSGRLRDWFR